MSHKNLPWGFVAKKIVYGIAAYRYILCVVELWRPEHAEGAIEVVRAVFDEYGFTWDETGYHADLYDVPSHYLQDDCPFYVFLDGPRVVGTAALDRFQTLPGSPGSLIEVDGTRRIAATDCALERLYVHPSARRRGIGSLLFEQVLSEARKTGCNRMEIWSDKRFGDAHRLYERFGAKAIGDRICDDPDVSPEWGLLLNL